MNKNVLVIHITREQSLDKILGLLVTYRRTWFSGSKIFVIVELETIHNQQDRVSGYYADVAKFADKVLVMNNTDNASSIFNSMSQFCHDASLVDGFSYVKSLLVNLRRSEGKIVGLIRWNEKGIICREIVANARLSGGVVYRYFKSLHDKGFGITSKDNEENKFLVYLRSLRLRFSSVFRGGACGLNVHDKYLCYESSASMALKSRGVPAGNIDIVTYPLATKEWFLYAKKRAGEIGLTCAKGKPIVSIFLRGPVSGRPDDEDHQVMSTMLLQNLLFEMKMVLDERFNSNYDVLIKPHPNQSVGDLYLILDMVGWSRNAVTAEGGAYLIAVSEFVITTYSSVCVEAASQGVKVVDFYRPTPYFLKIHPLGNVFYSYGVTLASSCDELREFVRDCVYA